MEQMNQYIQDPSLGGMPTGNPYMVQPGVAGPVFPGPTPSPWPPSHLMPGPTMQPQGAPAPMPGAIAQPPAPDGGHTCSCKGSSHSNPGDPLANPGVAPAAMPGDYLYEAYQFGPTLYSPAVVNPQFANPADSQWLGMNFRDDQFWKGVLLGAALALLVTNDTVQKAVLKGTASVWTAAQSGVEEVKEKFEDVKAEIQQKTAKKK